MCVKIVVYVLKIDCDLKQYNQEIYFNIYKQPCGSGTMYQNQSVLQFPIAWIGICVINNTKTSTASLRRLSKDE